MRLETLAPAVTRPERQRAGALKIGAMLKRKAHATILAPEY